MKAVEISSYLFYFNDNTTTEQIVDYVNTHIDDFMLNEAHSCSCQKIGDNTILITGDEDYVEENIFVIEPLLWKIQK